MKRKLTEQEELELIGPSDNQLNEQGVRCELCGNLLTNARLQRAVDSCHKHYTCDNSCRMGLLNRIRMQNPEFRAYISDLARKQAEEEYEIRSERMSKVNEHLWHDPEYQEFRDKKAREFTDMLYTMWEDEEFRKKRSKEMSEENWTRIAEGRHNFYDFESRCYIERNSLIVRFKHYEVAYLYECSDYNGYYKLGFSTDPDYRPAVFNDFNYNGEIMAIAQGPVPDIANLECELKLKFALRDKGMEVYDISQRSEILEFIHNYIQSSTTITLCE